MPIIDRIADFHIEMTERRRRIHAHPEAAFEEYKTAELISELLEAFGISHDSGPARTRVIGTLEGSVPSGRAVALRADMDALHIEERSNFPHASQHRGRDASGRSQAPCRDPKFCGNGQFAIRPRPMMAAFA